MQFLSNRGLFQFQSQIAAVSFMQATGGTVGTDGNYKYHILDNGDVFNITSMPAGATFELLVLGAGGGGGAFGGGGAGEAYYNPSFAATLGAYPAAVVGAGGTNVGVGVLGQGGDGGSTTFSTITAAGGGGGGGFSNTLMDGRAGGNGGGGGCKASPTFVKGTGGVGVVHNGGTGDASNNATSGGGGGGNMNNGSNGAVNSGGQGGNGLLLAITGTAKYYGAGGGGAGFSAGAPGGVTGGGRGETFGGTAAASGSDYGCGGGGSYAGNRASGSGFKGVVIIRYQYTGFTSRNILVVAGQSNGTDRFSASGNIPLKLTAPFYGAKTYYKTVDNTSDNGSWVIPQAGVNTQTGTPQTDKFAVTIPMINKLVNTYNIESYLIPTAVGGTYIANDVTPSWNTTHTNEYYDRMMTTHYLVARGKLAFTKEPILLWVHGESDSDTVAHGTAYQANLTALIAKFRTDSGFPNAKVIITMIRSDYVGPPNLGLSLVRTAMTNIDAADANVYLIDTSTAATTLSSDGQHYNPVVTSFGGTQSATNLGELIADLISTF